MNVVAIYLHVVHHIAHKEHLKLGYHPRIMPSINIQNSSLLISNACRAHIIAKYAKLTQHAKPAMMDFINPQIANACCVVLNANPARLQIVYKNAHNVWKAHIWMRQALVVNPVPWVLNLAQVRML